MRSFYMSLVKGFEKTQFWKNAVLAKKKPQFWKNAVLAKRCMRPSNDNTENNDSCIEKNKLVCSMTNMKTLVFKT